MVTITASILSSSILFLFSHSDVDLLWCFLINIFQLDSITLQLTDSCCDIILKNVLVHGSFMVPSIMAGHAHTVTNIAMFDFLCMFLL